MHGILPNILGIIENWDRWQIETEMVAVKLPDIMSGSISSEDKLSISVLVWLIILVGCKTKGINELEAHKKYHTKNI